MSFRTQLTLRVVFANKHEVASLRDKRFFHYLSPVHPPPPPTPHPLASSSHDWKLPIESNSSLSYFLERPLIVVRSFLIDNRD